jgi:hypothetical protein
MTAVSPGEVEATRGIWGNVIGRLYQTAQEWSLVRLRRDIVDPDLADVPDGYIYRANAVCLGLMGARHWEMAERIYEKLIDEVDAFQKSRAERRHRGALIANQAVCQILSGKIDLGIPRLLFTASVEDWETFGVPEASSHAMRILTSQFEEPAVELIRAWCEAAMWPSIGGRLPFEPVSEMVKLLGDGKWSLLALVRRTAEVWKTQRGYPSPYSAPRLLDGLRALCVTVEELAKIIGRQSADAATRGKFEKASTLTLKPSLERLFAASGSVWWSRLQDANKRGLTKFDARNAPDDFRAKLASILSWSAGTNDELIAKSFAVASLCRNYSAHELTPPADFDDPRAPLPPFIGAFTYSLVALLMLVQASTLCGHVPSGRGGP